MTNAAQSTRHVLMVRPAEFGPNPETAASNVFQRAPGIGDPAADARREFDAAVAALRAAGVDVIVFDDSPVPQKPDAIFPNNWVSFHEDGTVILYPLEAVNRRQERSPDLVADLERQGFRVARVIDLSGLEGSGRYLEGTGSLVIDHAGAIAFAALSSRTHASAAAEFARVTGLEVMTFDTRDENGRALYHTNVMLSVGERFAVVCPDVIADRAERRRVLERLAASGRDVITITPAQMRSFAANILEVRGHGDGPVIAMSAAARDSFDAGGTNRLERHGAIVAAPIPVIERVGGGSLRCMLVEIFLPRTI